MVNNKKNIFSALVDDIKKYIDLKAEFYTLTFAEKVSIIFAKVVLVIFIAILSLIGLSLFIFLIYSLLMSWIDIGWVVILILIGIVLLLIGIIAIFREKLIIKPIANMIVRTILNRYDYKDN